MLVGPLEALCTLLPGESQGLCPIPADLREVRRSQGPGTEEKIRFMAPFTSPPPHKGSFKALASYTYRQAGGTWEPRLALQEQWERLRGWGLLGPCSCPPKPLPNSGARLPVLRLQAGYLP